MGLLTRSSETAVILVADASVLISLNASGSASEIIAALPERFVVVDVVVDELEAGRSKGRHDADDVRKLIADGLLEVRSLGPAGIVDFERLVMGSASETLDDGEAATIAYALETGAVGLIDERKAVGMCGRRFPGLELRYGIDIFAREEVRRALGLRRLGDVVFNALQGARMRVPPHQIKWTVDLIGPRRAAECLSLPSSVRIQVKAREGSTRC